MGSEMCIRDRVQGAWCRVQGAGCRVQGAGAGAGVGAEEQRSRGAEVVQR